MIQSMKNKLSAKAKSRKGFTLAELLIVVAIIAILIAIAIPLFSSQLNSAKKAADDANFRSAKAVAVGLEIQAIEGVTGLPVAGAKFDSKTGDFSGATPYLAQSEDTTAGRVVGSHIELEVNATTKHYTVKWSK